MCGICGFFNANGLTLTHPQNKEILGNMTGQIIHRGPDGDGFYTDKYIGMGMRRLAIIDLKTGDQPQANEEENVIVVFNGEIYNFAEIKAELIKKNHVFHTDSDTEVIPHLYEEEGEDFVHFLNGMFAIALYDLKKRQLLLVRDRLGIKPLHLCHIGSTTLFASELKSLLCYPEINRKLSPEAVYNYLTFEYVSAPRTIYQNISKIMPGEMVVISPASIRHKRYWKPTIKKKEYAWPEICAEIKAKFMSAVQYRLIADVPLGVFLSGGIDSTLITGAASRFTSHIKTFTIGFQEETFNELPYARLSSDYFSSRHHEKILSYKEVIDLIPSIMNVLDEPLADASIIPTYLVSYLSRPEITVALSGDGGDELFLGYDTYKAYQIARFFRWIPKPLIHLAGSMSTILPASAKRLSLEFKIKKFLSGLAYKPEYANYIWWGAYPPPMKKKVLSTQFLNLIKDFPEFEPISFYDRDIKDIDDPLDRINYLDLHLYLQDDLLPKVDRMSMASSLEVRVPFLDYRLVELALSIKNPWRMSGLKTKHILKSALAEFLPPSLKKRPKIGFDIPLGPWLQNELKDYMIRLLDEQKIKDGGIFNFQFVNKLIQQHIQGKHNLRQLLWPIIIFQNWFEKYRPELPF